MLFFFFFQAEDGIRDLTVTGVQTCALPISIAAGVPVVPVYVHNTFEILPKGGIRLRPRPIRILVGEAIPTAGLSLDDRQRLADRTRAVLLGLRARVDSGDASR